ncbi:MAG TPA: hypothetical protein VK217_06930 [Acidimicrobiales bacterium]|nr:hypothetical protein [Acidimicrobiales bacterium]
MKPIFTCSGHFSATQGTAAGYDQVTVVARHGHRDPSITMKSYSHALSNETGSLRMPPAGHWHSAGDPSRYFE